MSIFSASFILYFNTIFYFYGAFYYDFICVSNDVFRGVFLIVINLFVLKI